MALPGYIVLRIGGEWLYSREGWDDLPEGVDDPTWLTIGYIVADLGALLLLASLIVEASASTGCATAKAPGC